MAVRLTGAEGRARLPGSWKAYLLVEAQIHSTPIAAPVASVIPPRGDLAGNAKRKFPTARSPPLVPAQVASYTVDHGERRNRHQ
jgi:hypothetical protein